MEMPTSRGDMLAFGGAGGPELARKICACLSIVPGKAEVLQFSAGNLFVRILENVRGAMRSWRPYDVRFYG